MKDISPLKVDAGGQAQCPGMHQIPGPALGHTSVLWLGRHWGDGLGEPRGGASPGRVWGLRGPAQTLLQGEPSAPSPSHGGDGVWVGLLGVRASLGLREGALLSRPSLVPHPHPTRLGPWKIPVQRSPSLFLSPDPQAWCGSPGRILRG